MDPTARQLSEFFEGATLGSPENAVGFMLWRLVHRFQREIDRVLAPLDLTHLQFTALAMVGWLNRGQRGSTQAEIARFSDIQPMQMSQILTVLEAKGLVDRTPSRTNARAKCVSVTRAGLAVLRRAMPLALEVQRRLFGNGGLPGGRFLAMVKAMHTRSAEPRPVAEHTGRPVASVARKRRERRGAPPNQV